MISGTFNFQRLAYLLICLCITTYLLYIGSSLFVPITYGIFIALMLKPIADRFESELGNRLLAICLTMLTMTMLLGGVFYFFFVQIQAVFTEANDIMRGFNESLTEIVEYFGEVVGMDRREANEMIDVGITSVVNKPFGILSTGLSTSGILLANITLALIYAFLFLLYRTAIRQFVSSQLSPESQGEGRELLEEVQQVAGKYLAGLGWVMLILGVLNSVGLFAIGIGYPLVWGFLGAMLAVIPYVGTTIGGLLPFLFAIATTENLWQPVAVVVLYMTVQFVEGNLITPKIVGNSVKINALAAIIGIIIGGMVWGLAGIVIAIPMLAIVRIFFLHIESLKPIALLLSDDLYERSGEFETVFNHSKYRLSNIFSGELEALRFRRLHKRPTDEVSKRETEIIPDSETQ